MQTHLVETGFSKIHGTGIFIPAFTIHIKLNLINIQSSHGSGVNGTKAMMYDINRITKDDLMPVTRWTWSCVVEHFLTMLIPFEWKI